MKSVGVRVQVAMLVVVVLATGLFAGDWTAAASTGPVVTIVSPTANQIVGGTVTVVADVRPEDTGPNRVLEVDFQVYGSGGGHRSESFPIDAGTCDTQCHLSATFDTASFVAPTEAMTTSPNLADGTTDFSVTAYTAFGQTPYASVNVPIDNHRPSLSLPDLPTEATNSAPTWRGYTDLTTTVHSAVDPAGTAAAVSSVRLFAPRSQPWPLADVSLPAPVTDGGAPGTGPISFDLRHVEPYFSGGAYLVAFDSNGTASAMKQVWLSIDRGFALTTTSVIAATRQSATVKVFPTWLNQATAPTDKITRLALYNDGNLLGSTTSIADPHRNATVSVTLPAGQELPAGDTTLTAVATDNHGVDRTSEAKATTTDPLVVAWTIGSLRSTSVLPIRVDIDTATHYLAFGQLDLRVDGHPLAAKSVYSAQATTLTAPAEARLTPGRHRLTLTAPMLNGQQFSRVRDIDVLGAPAVTLRGASASTWGHPGRLTAHVALAGVAQDGVPVRLQSRLPSARVWTTRASATTGRAGTASFATSVVGARAIYRVVALSHGDGLTATSAGLLVATRAAFGRVPAHVVVRSGKSHRYSLSAQPASVGLAVTVQYRSSRARTWTTLARPRIAQHGLIAFTERLRRVDSYVFRVVYPATSRTVATISPAWSLRVTRR